MSRSKARYLFVLIIVAFISFLAIADEERKSEEMKEKDEKENYEIAIINGSQKRIREWYSNNQMKSEIFPNDINKNCINLKEWDVSGRLTYVAFADPSSLNGYIQTWDNNGMIKSLGFHKNCVPNGIFLEKKSDAVMISYYTMGNLIWSGNVSAEGIEYLGTGVGPYPIFTGNSHKPLIHWVPSKNSGPDHDK